MLNKHNKLPVQKLALYIQLSMTFETLVVSHAPRRLSSEDAKAKSVRHEKGRLEVGRLGGYLCRNIMTPFTAEKKWNFHTPFSIGVRLRLYLLLLFIDKGEFEGPCDISSSRGCTSLKLNPNSKFYKYQILIELFATTQTIPMLPTPPIFYLPYQIVCRIWLTVHPHMILRSSWMFPLKRFSHLRTPAPSSSRLSRDEFSVFGSGLRALSPAKLIFKPRL